MGQGEETRTVPSRAATPALQPTVITIIRKSGAHLWLYIVNSGALMLLIMGYVLLASYFMELAVMTTSENVEGTKSTLRTTENHTMASFITSSAAGMLNRNVCRGKRGWEDDIYTYKYTRRFHLHPFP